MNSITPFFRRAPLPVPTIALLLLLAVITGCSKESSQVTTMPHFSLPSALDGRVINSRDFQGQALIVTFFATWCAPCRQEVPTLVALQNRYSRRSFSVIGISVDQGDSRTVRDFIMATGINYPVVMSGPDTPKDFGNVFGIPTTFLVDRQGKILQRFDGYVDIGVLDHQLRSIMD